MIVSHGVNICAVRGVEELLPSVCMLCDQNALNGYWKDCQSRCQKMYCWGCVKVAVYFLSLRIMVRIALIGGNLN
jgi:hypothetical protein